jgi:aminopeptidase N
MVIVWVLIGGSLSAKDSYQRDPNVDIIHYCFRVQLNDSTDRIEGSADITFSLAKTTQELRLDLAGLNDKGAGMVVERVEAGGQTLLWHHENKRLGIEIPDTLSAPGIHSITVTYSGIPADGLVISKNKYGDRTFFADNWPDRARNWIPCVDHPSDKATVEFIVTAPGRYTIVSNGIPAAVYPVNKGTNQRNLVSSWKEEVPVPTKVMVFGAADFAWETAGYSKGIPVQSWVYAQDRLPGFLDYRPAVEIVTFYQDLIGPYSYKKLANVQSKTMFGGMENSGCIFYYEKSVTGKNNLQGLLAHEIAHQWFGDAVTEGDWHHIWLSEGFATYLEACYADSMLAGRNLSDNMAEMRKSVIRYHEKTHKPVIDTTIVNNMELLSANSYQKGAWVLHMLRQELGDELFWSGIRAFYATYRDRNAMSSDLQSVMEQVSGRKLDNFFRQWLEIPGQPVIQWSWTYDEKKKWVEIDIEQMQDQYDFEFDLTLGFSGMQTESGPGNPKSTLAKVHVGNKKEHFTLPVDFRVTEIKLDPGTGLLFQEF